MKKVLIIFLTAFVFSSQAAFAKKYYVECGSEGTYTFNTPSGWGSFFGGILDFSVGALQGLYDPSGLAYGLDNVRNGVEKRANKREDIEAQINYAVQYCEEKRKSEETL